MLLPAPFGPEQAEHFALANRQRKPVDRDDLAEGLSDVGQGQHGYLTIRCRGTAVQLDGSSGGFWLERSSGDLRVESNGRIAPSAPNSSSSSCSSWPTASSPCRRSPSWRPARCACSSAPKRRRARQGGAGAGARSQPVPVHRAGRHHPGRRAGRRLRRRHHRREAGRADRASPAAGAATPRASRSASSSAVITVPVADHRRARAEAHRPQQSRSDRVVGGAADDAGCRGSAGRSWRC